MNIEGLDEVEKELGPFLSEVTAYILKCTQCPFMLGPWSSSTILLLQAKDSGFHVKEGKIYCRHCGPEDSV